MDFKNFYRSLGLTKNALFLLKIIFYQLHLATLQTSLSMSNFNFLNFLNNLSRFLISSQLLNQTHHSLKIVLPGPKNNYFLNSNSISASVYVHKSFPVMSVYFC